MVWPLLSPKLGVPGAACHPSPPCVGCVLSHVVVEPWLLLGTSVGGIDCPHPVGYEDQLGLCWIGCCEGPAARTGLASAEPWCLIVCPLSVSLVEVVGWYSESSEALCQVCWLWDLPGIARQGQPPPVLCAGPPGISYTVIHRWLLLLLALEFPREFIHVWCLNISLLKYLEIWNNSKENLFHFM